MNRQKKLKVLVFSMAMVLVRLSPVTASAQSDGFFHGVEDYSFRGSYSLNNQIFGGSYSLNNQIFGGSYNLNNQTFGQAPLGTGLLILTAAGAGYAALKRKKH